MNTDDLIANLVQDPAPAPSARVEARLLPYLGAGLIVTALGFALALGPRPDLAAALAQPMVAAKTVLPLLLAALTLPLALRAARPGAAPGWPARALWALPLAVLALLVLALATTAPGDWLRLFIGHSIPVCLPAITLLSLPPLAGLIAALKRGAPVRPGLAGALAGLAAAGLATALYSTFCIEDSPLFYGIWYSAGIGIATGLGALAGRRWLRW
ncbi:NrsF family protein [Pseudooceanicola sp. 200-1SW]|uniref:NrsF family protein n=1 Tax=Pseudooceanicola sp. 200-1SW TaxID=3425949 RepID=UPI003D7F82B7